MVPAARAPAPADAAVGRALSRATALAVGERFLAGWDAFDRRGAGGGRASSIATLVERPGAAARGARTAAGDGLHGDLKLANVALLDDGRVALIDWQMMTLRARSRSSSAGCSSRTAASLPIEPEAVLASYRDRGRTCRRTGAATGPAVRRR